MGEGVGWMGIGRGRVIRKGVCLYNYERNIKGISSIDFRSYDVDSSWCNEVGRNGLPGPSGRHRKRQHRSP